MQHNYKRWAIAPRLFVLLTLALSTGTLALGAETQEPKPEATPTVNATATPTPTVTPSATPEAKPSAVPSETPKAVPIVTLEKPLEKIPDAYDTKKFGFMLTPLVSVPHPLYLDLNYRIFPKLSIAIGGGGLVLAPKISDLKSTKLGILAGDIRLRWHPWGRSFYMGVKGGMQKVFARATKPILESSYGNVETTAEVSLKYPFATPHMGWMWMWNSGFTLGFEFGVQVPMGVTTTVTANTTSTAGALALAAVKSTAEYQKMEKDLKDIGDQVGKIPLPVLTLVKFGWMF